MRQRGYKNKKALKATVDSGKVTPGSIFGIKSNILMDYIKNS